MKGRYLSVAIAVVLLAVVITVAGRRPPVDAPAVAPAPAPVVALTVAIEGGQLVPEMASVAKGTRVRLRVDVRGTRGARLALAGYEDRLAIPALEPGATWTGEFLADRPGEDFAWLLDGAPAGRLSVTGSHLVEGHR